TKRKTTSFGGISTVRIACPCGRDCSDCVYENLCGGCLEENCIHVRIELGKNRKETNCLFGFKKGIKNSCSYANLRPPKHFACISPWVLEDTIDDWKEHRKGFPDQPTQPKWQPIIPEVSAITKTTSRLNVWPEEGSWDFHKWNPIAWDMTGYLLDKVEGPPWFMGSDRASDNWRHIIGLRSNWIEDIILVDRLPDHLAIQTPASVVVAEYLNRLHTRQWNLVADEDAPSLWFMTHGYPSYIDWPPAWHWNLGIRMLSSFATYIGAATSDMLHTPEGVWYPDKSGRTETPIRAPYVSFRGESRLLFPPYAEMDWDTFPGIIPFIPGADTKQLSWFANQITGMGYEVLAIDAMNTISHENFKGLHEAVNCLQKAGAKHVIVYGPWPLHPPSDYVPTNNVSYIPCAHHMDMTNNPARFWQKRTETSEQEEKWKKIPNYRTYPLKEVAAYPDLEICKCAACEAAVTREQDPRGIWRFGHLLYAGRKWMKRTKSKKDSRTESYDKDTRLWYQGPSYTAFRKCLCHPSKNRHPCTDDFFDSMVFEETSMKVKFPDGFYVFPEHICWTSWTTKSDWVLDFPRLEV
ncbi:MAG: hypothetical protein RTU30_00600, partial [Candidatus Thorarchaeota archaeon]